MKKVLTVCIGLALVACAALAGEKQNVNLGNQLGVKSVAVTDASKPTPEDFLAERAAAALEAARIGAPRVWDGSLDDCVVPFPEGVESATTPNLPACWVQVDADGIAPTWVSSSSRTHTGVVSFEITYHAPQVDDWLISPGVALIGGTDYQLKYWRRANGYDERLDVWAGNTTQDVAGMTTNIQATFTFISSTYVQEIVGFTPAVDGTYYFGWHATSEDAFYLNIDDIELVTTPVAPAMCCYGDVCNLTCEDLTQTACAELGGTWNDGESCLTSNCPLPLAGDLCCTALPISTLPAVETGNNCGFADDYNAVCDFTTTGGKDVVYSYTPAVDQLVTFSLCQSSYDTKLYIYDGAPVAGSEIACNDDTPTADCPGAFGSYRSYLECVQLFAGHTYCIVVDGYGSSDCGDYVLTMEECAGCDVVCPEGAILEGEPVCADGYVDIFNGGCTDVAGGSVSPIACGDVVCGTMGTFLSVNGVDVLRDTDWYLLNVMEDNDSVTVCLTGEALTQLAIISVGPCENVDALIVYSATTAACEELCTSVCLPAGQYWIFVATAELADCGAEYVLSVSCQPCSEPFVCHCGEGANSHCTYATDGGVWPYNFQIMDAETIFVPIQVPIEYQITDVNVCLDLTHTFDGDVELWLISPLGTRVELSTRNGSSGDDYVCTTFDDEAANLVTGGSAPFSGSFIPEGSLADFDGENALGNWLLEVSDQAGGDTGWVSRVCLEFTYDVILPVAFGSFDAVAGDAEVTLNWNTLSETNVGRFEVYRDGAKVTELAATNNATGSTYSYTDKNLTNGTVYSYSLVSFDVNGARQDLATINATPNFGAASVTSYALHQNYPNPFNPTTNIAFDMVEAGNVTISVFNLLGQKVAELVNGRMDAGRHVVAFDATSMSSGLYLYKMEANGFTMQQKMILMK